MTTIDLELGDRLAPRARTRVFDVGERVVWTGDSGSLICDLSLRHAKEPDAVYRVAAYDGRWMLVQDEITRRVYGGRRRRDVRYLPRDQWRDPADFQPSIGSGYFRLAGELGPFGLRQRGECRPGDHYPTWGTRDRDELAPTCARCDRPCPEFVTRVIYWIGRNP